MSRRKAREVPLSQREVPDFLKDKAREPVCVILGSPGESANLVSGLELDNAVCYQMDLYQADRLRETLAALGRNADVRTSADLWDLPAEFQTAIFLPARSGERELKIDMVDQAYHVLRPGGAIIIWSAYDTDPFFPTQLKKVFGKVHAPMPEPLSRGTRRKDVQDTILWAVRREDRPRRRHEMVFHARIAGGEACRFVSRPGVFSYGRLDEGTRALAEVMEIEPGDQVLDLGCGCGAVGVFAAQKAGQGGRVTFLDSNVRALAVAEHNARANGVESFDLVASHTVEEVPERHFDVILANPPYYANSSIAQLFIHRARELLKPKGRFYLVTRQPDDVAEAIEDTFGKVQVLMRRGYTILCA
jgi:16S rRNA (guanine1207-N2)-methyltransferase